MNLAYINKLRIILCAGFAVITTQVSKAEHYGYPLGKDEYCSVWWAAGAYKIMRNDPVPSGKTIPVQIWSARNEYESFQVVLNPKSNLRNFKMTISGFSDKKNNRIDSENISIRIAEYVEVTKPTDYYGKVGWYPDPLPLLEESATIKAGSNQPFWITIKVPAETIAGKYACTINLTAEQWEMQVPVTLEVWNFTLPEESSVRSAFGIYPESIKQYHNLDTEEELRAVTDKYYRMLKDYKIAPTSPFTLYPMNVNVEGLNWKGGIFTTDNVHSGSMALKIIDQSIEETAGSSTTQFIPVNPTDPYFLSWYSRTEEDKQQYSVMIKCYDENKQYMPFENKMDVYAGKNEWCPDTLKVGYFRDKIKYITVHLFPVFRDFTGHQKGITWFDDVSLYSEIDGKNLLAQGDFEIEIADLDVETDFTEFDKAGKKYLDEYGFNAFNLHLEGLPSGTYYAQKRGILAGFEQGTVKYNILMKKYLTQVQQHLEDKGWLGKEYTYWFDEPNTENYPFVREGMEIIHRAAPKITRFITEHQPGEGIMDVTEISCTVIGRLDPDMMKKLTAEGREFWSYLCCCPKAPWLSLFIDHDAINMRMWLWISYQYQLRGILIWSANYWNSTEASPKDYLQNPWEDPMSYTTGYGSPFGKQSIWGNGDGRFLYPPSREPNDHSVKYLEPPIPCLRLEILRDGIEDYEYLMLLEKVVKENVFDNTKLMRKAEELLVFPGELFTSPKEYNMDPKYLLDYRKHIGQLLHNLKIN